jgi:hypothetical protein
MAGRNGISILLETEEHKALPRFDEFLNTLVPKFFREGRAHYGITEVQQLTIDHEELGTPFPPGVVPEPIEQFPTPGKAIRKIAVGDRRRMLERLYPEYAELSSFTHGLPHSDLLKCSWTSGHSTERFSPKSKPRKLRLKT